MKKKQIMIALYSFNAVRFFLTVMWLVFTPIPVYATMFTVPFFIAGALGTPRLPVGLLELYIACFVAANILCLMKRTRMISVAVFIVLYCADILSFVFSFFYGSNHYLCFGIPICLMGCLLAVVAIIMETDKS